MNTIFATFKEVKHKCLPARLRRRASALVAGSAGGMLVEAVVAVSLMTIVGTAVLSGLSTTHISGAKTERQSISENIARNQMAHVFSQPYNDILSSDCTAYSEYGVLPSGFAVCTNSQALDVSTAQKVIVVVTLEGNEIFRLESVKSQ